MRQSKVYLILEIRAEGHILPYFQTFQSLIRGSLGYIVTVCPERESARKWFSRSQPNALHEIDDDLDTL